MKAQNRLLQILRRTLVAFFLCLLLFALFIAAVAADAAWKHHEVKVFLSGGLHARLVKVVFPALNPGYAGYGRVVVRSPRLLAYLQKALTEGGASFASEVSPAGLHWGPGPQAQASLYFSNWERLRLDFSFTPGWINVSDDHYCILDCDWYCTVPLPEPVPDEYKRMLYWLGPARSKITHWVTIGG